MTLVAQGYKWSGSTPTLLDVHALGIVTGDYSCDFRDLFYVRLLPTNRAEGSFGEVKEYKLGSFVLIDPYSYG